MSQHDDPDQHDIPRPTESMKIAEAAKHEFNRMTPEQQAQVRADWEARPEWQKQDLRDEVELDLL